MIEIEQPDLATRNRPPDPRAHDCFRCSAGAEPGDCFGDEGGAASAWLAGSWAVALARGGGERVEVCRAGRRSAPQRATGCAASLLTLEAMIPYGRPTWRRAAPSTKEGHS